MLLDAMKEILFHYLQMAINVVHHVVVGIFGQRKIYHDYETSAQVFKILFRNKPMRNWEFSNKTDFLHYHEKFCHPNIILDDNISLYTVTTTEAIFVDCGNVNVFEPKHVFVYNGQFENAVRMIVMPLSSFHLISESIPQPKVPVIHLANHGRCGSTLLSNIFEAIPGTLSISETNAFTDIAEFSRKGDLTTVLLMDMLKSTVMCTLKHANDRNSKLVLIKCQSIAVFIVDVFVDVVPFVKQVYMYRQPLKFVQSYEKLMFTNKWDKLSVEMCHLWSGIGNNRLMGNYPVYSNDHTEKLSSFSRWSLIWITCAAAFNNLVQSGYNIKSLKYEDLIKNPDSVMKSLFDFTGVSVSSMPDITKVLGCDSQAGTPFSSRHINKEALQKCLTPVTDQLKEEVAKLCKDFSIEEFWVDLHLSNRIV